MTNCKRRITPLLMQNIPKKCDQMFYHKTNLYKVNILDYYQTSLFNAR